MNIVQSISDVGTSLAKLAWSSEHFLDNTNFSISFIVTLLEFFSRLNSCIVSLLMACGSGHIWHGTWGDFDFFHFSFFVHPIPMEFKWEKVAL